MSKTGKVWSATSLVWWPLTWCSNPKCFLATVTLNERTFFSTVAQLGLKYQSPSHNSKPPAGRRSDYQNSQSRQILVSQLIWGAGTVFVQWSSVPSNSNSRGEAGMAGIVQDYKTMRGFFFFWTCTAPMLHVWDWLSYNSVYERSPQQFPARERLWSLKQAQRILQTAA